MNPILALNYEPSIEHLGNDDYYDVVAAADFPSHELRWRNDDVLVQFGLDPDSVTDADLVEAFGQFKGREPLMASCMTWGLKARGQRLIHAVVMDD